MLKAFLVIAVLAWSPTVMAEGDWAIETVEAGIRRGTDSSLVLDSQGYAHISYLEMSYPDDDGNLMYAYEDATGWHFETVDSSLDTGYDTSINLDSSGYPHIIYQQRKPTYSVRYAYKDAAGWHTELAKACSWLDRAVAMDLDTSGRAHISFYQYSDGGSWTLQYGHRGGSGWTFAQICSEEDVLGGFNVNGNTAIAVDVSGTVCVAFMSGAEAYDLKFAYGTSGGWTIDTVDSASRVYRQLSLDLGESGWPHIAYFDGSNVSGEGDNDLHYAYKDASGWHTETVDTEGNTGWYSSLAVASDGYPHISYFQHDLSQLKYAYKDSYGWHIEAADNGGYVGWHSSIQLDATNGPHVAYYEWHYAYALKYAVRENGVWSTETVASGGAVGEYSSIAVEDDASPHISYYCGIHGDLKHAWQSSGIWQAEIVDADGDVGWYTSVALDRSQYPHISYYDVTNSSLKYACQDGSGWHTGTVDSDGDVGMHTSIALGPSGYAHISYYDATHSSLKYAFNDSGGWHTETVDDAGSVGLDTSIALDASSYPHISYYDYTHSSLKYAFKDSGGWHVETVDDAGSVGKYTSIALDASGRPHVSYFDATPNVLNLKYAYQAADGWQIETVDASPIVGEDTALAIDPYGRRHISYFARNGGDGTVHDLKYAFWDTTQWCTEYVETGCDAGEYSSIALDRLGGRHISSYHLGHSRLKYAYAPPIPPLPTEAILRVDEQGNVLADQTFYGAAFETGSADVAEWVVVSELVEPGDVVEFDPRLPEQYRIAQNPFSPLVAGVISTIPGVTLGTDLDASEKALLALIGIVPVKVTGEGGPIQPGDLLVTSSTPGHAMRWSGDEPCFCALVGKALVPMIAEAGVILVLLTAH